MITLPHGPKIILERSSISACYVNLEFQNKSFWAYQTFKLRVKSRALNKFLGKISMGKMQLYSFNMGYIHPRPDSEASQCY
jgi:hypothetical protein